MVKKKLHHRVLHHGIRQGIPFGAGTGIGIFWAIDYVIEQISALTEDADTIQSCIEFIQSVSP